MTTTDDAVVQELEEYLATAQTAARPGLSVCHVKQFNCEGRLEVRKLRRDWFVLMGARRCR